MRALLIATLLAHAGLAQMRWPSSRVGAIAQYFEPQSGERKLRCEVSPVKPALGFSLRFQSGYVMRVPLDQYEGEGHRWTVALKVTPSGGSPVYLVQRFRLPKIPKTKAEAQVSGGFMVGEGTYDVSWVLTDDSRRIYRKHWRMEARLRGHERNLTPAIPPATVREFSLAVRRPAADAADPPLHLTILLHAAPAVPSRTALRAEDGLTLVGMLASILEQLPAQSVRLVAFNLDQQKEVFRQEEFTGEALNDLWQAIGDLELGTVDYRILKNRRGDVDLLQSLVTEENLEESASHVVVFVGPMARPGQPPPREIAETVQASARKFYYLQYSPAAFMWTRFGGLQMTARPIFPDAISLLMGRLQGKTFLIRSAGELARALEQISQR